MFNLYEINRVYIKNMLKLIKINVIFGYNTSQYSCDIRINVIRE